MKVSSMNNRLAAALIMAAGATTALANDCRLGITSDRSVLAFGESAFINVFAHFPPSAYAFADANFDVLASSPMWTQASDGVIAGPLVSNIAFSQEHNPFNGNPADPTNPLRVWSGVYSPSSPGPKLIKIETLPQSFAFYPSELTSSSVPCDADPWRAYIWVEPMSVGNYGQIAPAEGTAIDQTGPESFIASPDEDEAILIGLLLPAVQKVREAAARTEIQARVNKATPKLMLACATGTHSPPTEELSLNFSRIDFDDGSDPVFELTSEGSFSHFPLICMITASGQMVCLDGALTASRSQSAPLIRFDRLPTCLTFAIEQDDVTKQNVVVVTTCDTQPFNVQLPGVYEGLVFEPIEIRFAAQDPAIVIEALEGIIFDLQGLPQGPEGMVTFNFAGPCRVDLNNDGILDFFDVQAFLNYFAQGNMTADFNNDGILDFFDVQAYLDAFAAGCP